MEIALVEILNKYADLQRSLDYLVPQSLEVSPGSRVQVPLGTRVVEGIVLQTRPSSDVPGLKQIISKDDRSLPVELVDLARWLSIKAGCSVSAALSAMLPPKASGIPLVRWQVDELAAAAENLTEKQQQVVNLVRGQKPMSKSEITRALKISPVPINNLITMGVLISVDSPGTPWTLEPVEKLTPEQTAAITAIQDKTRGFKHSAQFLLHGVTGSGKTEVYIRLAQQVIDLGRQVLILVPEIALTAQLVARFKTAFGTRVTVLHSGLNNSVRAGAWDQISRGQVDIVIGTRSAVFAPLGNLGLVVVDEEHEPALKQEETPRYHARDVASFRARTHKAALVLGSATPALESYARAEAGRYALLELPNRVHWEQNITTQMVDMRRELQEGNRDMLSRELQSAIKDTLSRGEQAILFLNRRGVAPTVLCRNCGFRYSCSNCSTALTLHRHGVLKCHHCGAGGKVAKSCPQCGSGYLRELGLGTQKLEYHLCTMFPGQKICRLDSDTAANAQDKEQQLHGFYLQGAGILLGTQMIVKGLDFPKVTLVGIVLADLSLGMTDFRAAERTFQLVTQAAGRTGRAEKPGSVIIQTYQPEHYSLRFALAGDYHGFYKYEMRMRSSTGMPPYSSLTRIIVSSQEQDLLVRQVEELNPHLTKEQSYEMLHSGPAPIEKLKGRFRWHILLRHAGNRQAWLEIDQLRQEAKILKGCRVVFDNNPNNFM
jgi:primosomal protein N' (replication factor Y)